MVQMTEAKVVPYAEGPNAEGPRGFCEEPVICLRSELEKERERKEELENKRQEQVRTEKEGVSLKRNSRSSILLTQRPVDTVTMFGKYKLIQWYAIKLLSNQRFDAAIGVVILFNSISIGIVSTFEVQNLYGDPGDKRDLTAFEVLEHCFLAIYSMELVVRFFAMGLGCLSSHWVKFDFVLVVLGAVSSWVIAPILSTQEDSGAGMEALAPLMVLRVMRLLRLARSLRLLVQFKTLWMLVRGLLSSAGTMFYTFGLMMLILYVFACLGVELITKDEGLYNDPDIGEMVQQYFSSVTVIMLTLVQFITMDSIGSIYTPIVHKQPYLIVYFMIFLIVVSISLMNLVTAVIVEGAIEQGNQDKEVNKAYEKKRIVKLLPMIRQLFFELDEDGNGTVSWEEMESAPEEVKLSLEQVMQTDQLHAVFELLDTDDSGEIGIDEFCDGLTKMITSEEPMEFIRLRKQMSQTRVDMGHMDAKIDGLQLSMQRMEANIEILLQRPQR